jgi:hypothetical protein
MLKIATLEDVRYVADRMRPHDRAERLALSHGDDPVAAAVNFLALPHLAVTVWKGTPIAVIGVVFPHPGVASTIFFATDEFRHVALATTRFIRRTLFPILLSTGIHRLQVCSMDGPYGTHRWIEAFGARQEAFLHQYGRNREDFRLFTLSKAGMARITKNPGEAGV